MARGVFCLQLAPPPPGTPSRAASPRRETQMTEQATGAGHHHPQPRRNAAQQPVTEQVTGAQSLIRSLEEVGADTVFGIPGGAILPAYDPMFDSKRVRHILVRHEQGAGHAATGYAQATGKVGVCMATSGPGATNLVTPIADANLDSVPHRGHHRPGRLEVHRHRRLPGGGHRRHHHADHQAQLPGHQRRRHPAHHRGGLPHRRHRPPGTCAGRHRQGRPSGQDRLQLAASRPTCPATARSPSRTPSRSARRPS